MTPASPLGLFEGVGIELEYMIVDQTTLDVRPCADQLMRVVGGGFDIEVDRGPALWSNELSLHVVELKTNGPAATFKGLSRMFAEQISDILELLTPLGATLLPSAMHPWMDPERELCLWPHENAEIYAAFDRIFGCRGHGWANLQSMHINLPFRDDAEFGRLHAAIRLVLPLIPGLAASSPMVEGSLTGVMDNRLIAYRNNSVLIPSITGHVVPEAVFSQADYQRQILERIYRDLAPLDPEAVLQHEWVNARGAIARFERMAIEIRTIDLQECPHADLAIAELVVAVVKALVSERFADYERQCSVATELLSEYHAQSVLGGGAASWPVADYLELFGIRGERLSVREVWAELSRKLLLEGPDTRDRDLALKVILSQGTLAERIVAALKGSDARPLVMTVYQRLAACLAQGEMFEPHA